jgi:16S rRNA (cytidine1402-2'-O)-methyltransferase
LRESTTISGCLYLVATPLGNLEDITIRALRILSEVKLVAAEDTRQTRKLLSAHGIANRVISYREHNHARAAVQITGVLKGGGDVALVSDAGTPALSDPGTALVRNALDAGFRVTPVPGPAAAVAALVASGLSTERFTFLGFLPRKAGQLERQLEDLFSEPGTLVVYESPRRIAKTLAAMAKIFGERSAVVAREISKLHETFDRGSLPELAARYAEGTRGEVTLVVEGAGQEKTGLSAEWREIIDALHAAGGLPPGRIATLIAGLAGVSRKQVYELLIK